MNETSPEPTPVAAPQKIAGHLWVQLFLFTICLFGIIGAGLYIWTISKPPATTDTPVPIVNDENPQTEAIIPTQFYSNKANLSFNIPTGWREVNVASSTFPVGFSDPQFMFLNQELGCVIAAGKFERNAANYVQTSFGGRVKGPISQFDGNWYTNQAYHKEPIIFSKDTRQYLTYELRETYNLDNVDILLWQRDNTSVPDVCNRDYESLLKSTQHHFSPITLKDYFNGTLFIRTENIGAKNVETRLLFTNNEDKNTYEVVALPPGTGHGGKVFVRNGSLYALAEFSGSDSQLHNSIIKIDPVNASVEELPLVTANEKVITHYVTPDTIYFMVASSSARCTGYRESCRANLYAYDFDSNEQKLLSTNIASAQFDGFDTVTGTLYLNRGWGDAGCVSNKIDGYQIITGTLTNVISFSGCVDDSAYTTYQASIKDLYSRFNEERSSVISYNIGSLLPSEQDIFGTYSTFIFVK